MIRIYPVETETLVVSHDRHAVIERIGRSLDVPFETQGIPKVIQGWIKDDTFRITIRLRRQQFFMPQVKGRIEATSKGSLVFLEYALFPGTKVLLTFWTLVLPLVSIPLVYEYNNIWILPGFILFALFMHIIAWASFRVHIKTSQEIIHGLLA